MSSRRLFLSAGITSAALAALSARANSAGAAAPSASPAPSPTASPPPEALAQARSMTRYDARLTENDIETIARQIAANAKDGARLNPSNRRLKNADEPATAFRAIP